MFRIPNCIHTNCKLAAIKRNYMYVFSIQMFVFVFSLFVLFLFLFFTWKTCQFSLVSFVFVCFFLFFFCFLVFFCHKQNIPNYPLFTPNIHIVYCCLVRCLIKKTLFDQIIAIPLFVILFTLVWFTMHRLTNVYSVQSSINDQ